MTVQRAKGFTVIELMVVVAVLGVLAAIAAPNMREYLDRHRLINQARAIANLAQFARSEAIKHSASGDAAAKVIAMTVTPGSSWYVGLANDASTACTISPDTCKINESGNTVSQHVSADECSSCSTMSVPSAQFIMKFDLRGLVDTATGTDRTITLTSPLGKQISLNISRLGRISSCSPSGTTTFINGFQTCS